MGNISQEQVHGSEALAGYSDKISEALDTHLSYLLAPEERKMLRRFSVREVARFLKLNENTFRHYIKNADGRMPIGELVGGNRRMFKAEDIDNIRQFLFNDGKIAPEAYPRRQGDQKLNVLCTFNLKGGVSKTSSAILVAQLLGLRGHRVLCIDLDPQASMSDIFQVRPDIDGSPSIYEALRYNDPETSSGPKSMRDVIQKTYFHNVDIAASEMMLTEFEYETAISFKTGMGGEPFHRRMSAAIASVEADYDVVVFDTPPQLSFSVISALFASTGLIIPLNASMLDSMSLGKFLGMAGDLMKAVEGSSRKKDYDFIRFLITRFEPTDSPQVQMAGFLRTIFSGAVLKQEFLKSTVISDASNSNNTVMELEPSSFTRKSYDRLMDSVELIVDELEELCFAARHRSAREAAAENSHSDDNARRAS